MSITEKVNKKHGMMPEKTTWSAQDRAKALARKLLELNWEIPKAIISDRDAKYLCELWKGIFQELGTRLPASLYFLALYTTFPSGNSGVRTLNRPQYLSLSNLDTEHILHILITRANAARITHRAGRRNVAAYLKGVIIPTARHAPRRELCKLQW
jgi:hypothetical protein